jgi:hypothetical protein
MRTLCCLLLALTATFSLTSVQADVITLKQNAALDVPRPTRGMTMSQVESQFGAPREKYPAVGQPPITRWDYDNFSVFFEHQYVLHAVVQHKLNQPGQ